MEKKEEIQFRSFCEVVALRRGRRERTSNLLKYFRELEPPYTSSSHSISPFPSLPSSTAATFYESRKCRRVHSCAAAAALIKESNLAQPALLSLCPQSRHFQRTFSAAFSDFRRFIDAIEETRLYARSRVLCFNYGASREGAISTWILLVPHI